MLAPEPAQTKSAKFDFEGPRIRLLVNLRSHWTAQIYLKGLIPLRIFISRQMYSLNSTKALRKSAVVWANLLRQ